MNIDVAFMALKQWTAIGPNRPSLADNGAG